MGGVGKLFFMTVLLRIRHFQHHNIYVTFCMHIFVEISRQKVKIVTYCHRFLLKNSVFQIDKSINILNINNCHGKIKQKTHP